jgi:hypothetical protein
LRWLVIDLRWLGGLHLESGSLKLPSQPTMSRLLWGCRLCAA